METRAAKSGNEMPPPVVLFLVVFSKCILSNETANIDSDINTVMQLVLPP